MTIGLERTLLALGDGARRAVFSGWVIGLALGLLAFFFVPAGLAQTSPPEAAAVPDPAEIEGPVATNRGSTTRGRETNFLIPRFVTTKGAPSRVRNGPGTDYFVTWEFAVAGLPIEIIAEQREWRKVRFVDGREGWMHRSLISGKRTALVIGERQDIFRRPTQESSVLAKVDPLVRLDVDQCRKDWCLVEVQGVRGWVEKPFLYGIYLDEEF